MKNQIIVVFTTNQITLFNSNSQSSARSAEESDGGTIRRGWDGCRGKGTEKDQGETKGEKGQGNTEAAQPIRTHFEKVCVFIFI